MVEETPLQRVAVDTPVGQHARLRQGRQARRDASKRRLPNSALALEDQAGHHGDTCRTARSAGVESRTRRRSDAVRRPCATGQPGRHETADLAYAATRMASNGRATSGHRKWRTTAETQGNALMNEIINALPAQECLSRAISALRCIWAVQSAKKSAWLDRVKASA